MAVTANIKDSSGTARDLYVRLNNFEALSNHGAPAEVRFRGFPSEEAFKSGAPFTWEMVIPFMPDLSETSEPIWKQAYSALRAYDFTVGTQLSTSLLIAASMAKDDEIKAGETRLALNTKIAEDNNKTDDPQVVQTLTDIRNAIDALRTEKARIEGEIESGRVEVERLTGLSEAFKAAQDA